MSKMRCPGQDTRYWKPGDIFSLQCNNCKNEVEFFKDDVNRKCPHCSTRIQNPKISMGCAQWCEHAKECLGYDPAEVLKESEKTEVNESLSEKIIAELKSRYGDESATYKEATLSLNRAFEMLKGETADPRIVIPASLLIGIVVEESKKDNPDSDAALSDVATILSECGLDDLTIDDISDLLRAIINQEEIDISEYKIVVESYAHKNERIIN